MKEVQDFMRTLTDIGRALRNPVLLLAALALSSLVGCKGAADAPFGSTIEITGPFVLSNVTTTQTTKQEKYHVTVLDSGGQPMGGVKVQLNGIFTAGDQITMAGAGPQDAPANLSSNVTMGYGGFADFLISAPSLSIRPLALPVLSASALASGGTLTVGTFSYEVAAVDALGGLAVSTTIASATTTTVNSSVALSWTSVPGATSYNVYGDNGTGAWTLKTSVTGTTGFTDVSVGGSPVTQPVPGSNTSGAAVNSLKGSIMAVSGGVSAIVDVNF